MRMLEDRMVIERRIVPGWLGGLSDFASFGLRGMRWIFKGQEEKRI